MHFRTLKPLSASIYRKFFFKLDEKCVFDFRIVSKKSNFRGVQNFKKPEPDLTRHDPTRKFDLKSFEIS